jgi:biopolymer transport protein TolR
MSMGTSGDSRSSRATLSEINVTPLVDVMLVLLIIFMVATPMMQQGIDVNLPETANSGIQASTQEPFVLVINKAREISIGKADVPMKALREKLAAIFEKRRDKNIYVQADKAVDYGTVAEVMAEIRAAGIYQISLVTLPKTGS